METTGDGAGERGTGGLDETRAWLDERARRPTSTEDAIRVFDRLEGVAADEMLGPWRGAEVKTGHPFDGLLESFGWYGKLFYDEENVHPLLFRGVGDELYSLNASLIPGRLLTHIPSGAALEMGRRLFKRAGPRLRTTRPTARLRMLEHRGVLTAAMIYDALPIHDVYRRVDADTVMGWMDLRGQGEPFFFALHRDPRPGRLFEELK